MKGLGLPQLLLGMLFGVSIPFLLHESRILYHAHHRIARLVETWKHTPLNQSPIQIGRSGYTIHLFSLDPLVIYVEGFINEEEAQHLISLA